MNIFITWENGNTWVSENYDFKVSVLTANFNLNILSKRYISPILCLQPTNSYLSTIYRIINIIIYSQLKRKKRYSILFIQKYTCLPSLSYTRLKFFYIYRQLSFIKYSSKEILLLWFICKNLLLYQYIYST